MGKKRLAWNMTAEGTGGRRIAVGQTFYLDAFDEVTVTADTDTSVVAEIQPAAIAADVTDVGKVLFLVIRASDYGEDLTCQVRSGDGTVQKTLPLEGPLVLMGQSALYALADPGTSLPQVLYFNNGLDEEVSIDVFVGRLAADTLSS